MSDNLKLWEAFADIDPKFTKPITGKPYKGTSPNPQYVIRCLTEMFGPVGQGFGWRVIADEFTPLGDEVLHWCRIEFWHTDRANTFESYGQTKASYTTNGGKLMVDEDAPKKSLTDAIIKAASHVGIAANIFLGRWDDQKYVAHVNQEYREEEKAAQPQPEPPAFDPADSRTRMIAAVAKQHDQEGITKLTTDKHWQSAFGKLPPPMQLEVTAAVNARKQSIHKQDEHEFQ